MLVIVCHKSLILIQDAFLHHPVPEFLSIEMGFFLEWTSIAPTLWSFCHSTSCFSGIKRFNADGMTSELSDDGAEESGTLRHRFPSSSTTTRCLTTIKERKQLILLHFFFLPSGNGNHFPSISSSSSSASPSHPSSHPTSSSSSSSSFAGLAASDVPPQLPPGEHNGNLNYEAMITTLTGEFAENAPSPSARDCQSLC